MAAGLGYIEFATGDILTAATANGYLASQTVMVFASSAARASAITSPQEGMFSYLKDTNATEYYTGSAWTALGGGGGKVLQVVSATTSTPVTVASTTFTDTGLTATITPSSASSKILVIASQNMWSYSASTEAAGRLKLVRASTDIWNQSPTLQTTSSYAGGATAIEFSLFIPISYLDSPATTSSTTYKVQGKTESTANSGEVNFQKGANVSTITLMEIGA
jgi:hypothetical protein